MLDKLKQSIYVAIQRIFSKVYGQSLPVEKLEMLTKEINNIASAVEKIAELKSLASCQKLNDATAQGFKKVSEALEAEVKERQEEDLELTKRLNEIERKIEQNKR